MGIKHLLYTLLLLAHLLPQAGAKLELYVIVCLTKVKQNSRNYPGCLVINKIPASDI